MRMLLEWHSSSQKPIAQWAAINIVLALSYRLLDDRLMDDERLSQCMRNVESVMTVLMDRDEDLLGLQVLLGAIIIFHSSEKFKTAMVLIGSAVGLAQNLGLHRKKSLVGLPPADAMHRQHLFWITYILDRVRRRCLRLHMSY